MAQWLGRGISDQGVPGSNSDRCTFRLEQVTTQEAVEGRPTWTDCDEAGDYVVPNVLKSRDLVLRPDNMDETVPHNICKTLCQRHARFRANHCFTDNKMADAQVFLSNQTTVQFRWVFYQPTRPRGKLF